jgi:flavin-dependent dehydrogenase
LLDKVLATNPGPTSHVHFEYGDIALDGEYPTIDGINTIHSPRRYLLDKILIDAAVEAGVELREGFITEELLWEDGHVAGIRGRLTSGGTVTEQAKIVIGADGKHSLVAKSVDAPKYDEQPTLTCGYYSYWEGLHSTDGAIYALGQRLMGAWPTNDNKTMIYVAWPAAEFDKFRSDVEGNYRATIDLVPALAERVHQGRLAERIVGSGDMPNFYRKPYGPGWALVGDAGFTKDPVAAFGISDAFRDAELLAEAIDEGFGGRQPLETALSQYEQKRNKISKPMYDMTLDNARMAPRPMMQIEFMRALQHNPAMTSQFFGVMTGAVNPADFLTPQNLFQVLKLRGMAKIMLSRIFPVPQRRAS